jgi:hypothetical protein
MKLRLAALAGALAVAAGLAGCAYDAAYYGPPPPYADVDYDGYYDGYYGPFYGGYWGGDGQFYYWDKNHQHYHRDVGNHFRQQGGGPGFTAIRGHAPAAPRGGGGRGPGGGGGRERR